MDRSHGPQYCLSATERLLLSPWLFSIDTVRVFLHCKNVFATLKECFLCFLFDIDTVIHCKSAIVTLKECFLCFCLTLTL